MLVLRNIYFYYKLWFHENAGGNSCIAFIHIKFQTFWFLDPRFETLPLIGSPIPVLTLVTLYLMFVNGRGQKWMEQRKPFELRKAIQVYNVFQMVANAAVCYMARTDSSNEMTLWTNAMFINRPSRFSLSSKTSDSSVFRKLTQISVKRGTLWLFYRTFTTFWSLLTFWTPFSSYCGKRTTRWRSFTFTIMREWSFSDTRKFFLHAIKCCCNTLQR